MQLQIIKTHFSELIAVLAQIQASQQTFMHVWIKTANALKSKRLKSLKIYKANLKTWVANSFVSDLVFFIRLCKHFPGWGTLDFFFSLLQ